MPLLCLVSLSLVTENSPGMRGKESSAAMDNAVCLILAPFKIMTDPFPKMASITETMCSIVFKIAA